MGNIGSGGITPDRDTTKVRISGDDTTPAYLLNKLTAGAGITITETTPGGNETATIAATGGASTPGHLKLIDSLESEASESRSQSTYGGGVSLSTLNLVNGTEYIWKMFCEHRVEDSNSPVFVEFSVGGSVVGEQYLEVTSNTNNNDYEPRFCIKKLSNVSGTVVSTIKHKDGGDGSVSFVRKLRILVFEVLQ